MCNRLLFRGCEWATFVKPRDTSEGVMRTVDATTTVEREMNSGQIDTQSGVGLAGRRRRAGHIWRRINQFRTLGDLPSQMLLTTERIMRDEKRTTTSLNWKVLFWAKDICARNTSKGRMEVDSQRAAIVRIRSQFRRGRNTRRG